MIAWTTPTLPILVRGGNILDVNCRVFFTIEQGGTELTLEPWTKEATDDGVMCELHFSQLESGRFEAGRAKLQVNVVDSNDLRAASKFVSINIGSNLIDKEIDYGV